MPDFHLRFISGSGLDEVETLSILVASALLFVVSNRLKSAVAFGFGFLQIDSRATNAEADDFRGR